jgi:copper transport protein
VLLGLSAALGGSLALHLLAPASAVGPPAPGAASAVVLAWRCSVAGAATAATGALVLLVTQLALGGTRALPLLWSTYGVRWGLRELGLLVLLGAALSRPRLPRSAAGWAPLAAGATLACVGTALLGHSGTGRSPQPTRVLASAAHLGAAATWAGCVALLALVLAPQVRRDAAARESARAVLQRFGPPATVCVAGIVVTGVYLSSEVVGSVDAAIRTIYGRTLLLKVALAAVAGTLALVNTVRLRRRSRRSTPRRTVLAEAAAAVGVLALAAVLTSGQPAMEPQLVQGTTRATDGLVDRKVADLQEAVSIRPNRPGPNIVLVDVFDTRRPAPSPVRGVVVSLTPPGGPSGAPLRAEPLGDGRWSVSTTLEAAGAVTVHVAVQRGDLPDTTATYGWTVGGAPEQARPAVVSTASLGPGLRVAAAVLLLALLGAGLLATVVRLLGRRPFGRPGLRPVPDPVPDEAPAGRRPDPVRL